MADPARKKNARIEFRVSRRVKAMLERAASLKGLTLSAYAISTLVDDASKLTEREDRFVLSNQDRDIFLSALDEGPNEALIQAAREYQSQFDE
jgi:uncharacterized protein (DUF1778 family)